MPIIMLVYVNYAYLAIYAEITCFFFFTLNLVNIPQ